MIHLILAQDAISVPLPSIPSNWTVGGAAAAVVGTFVALYAHLIRVQLPKQQERADNRFDALLARKDGEVAQRTEAFMEALRQTRSSNADTLALGLEKTAAAIERSEKREDEVHIKIVDSLHTLVEKIEQLSLRRR